MTSPSQLVIPGQSIGPVSKFSPGPGTHITNGHIQASVLTTNTNSIPTHNRTLLPILAAYPPDSTTPKPVPLLPAVGTLVYARITRLTRQQAHASILTVSSTVATHPFRGILRAQDVRSTEKDKVKLADCFHVGDIVRALVISLGDQGGYYLSTAANELGVIMAWSEDGNGCVPISWREVRDDVTGVKEARKVARPF
jgi:exosome complex component CSL4